MRSPFHPPRWLLALPALAALSCSDDVQFNIKAAPEFSGKATTLSVFGVFRDGRLSPESWIELGSAFASSFGQGACEAGFGEQLRRVNPDLFGRADEYAKSNGVTDDLLERFAPSAKGDVIMTIHIADRSASTKRGRPPPTQPQAMGQGRGQGPRHMAPGAPVDRGDFDMSASFYSVRLHRSVARMNMSYAGALTVEAVNAFLEKLEKVIPGSTCQGWAWGEPPPRPPSAPAL